MTAAGAGSPLPRLATWEKGVVATSMVVAAAHARFLPGAPIADDAFITFRYARNLAGGFGLVWNRGEPPVEGFTSPLHLLFLSLADLAGFDLLRTSLVLGIVCAALVAGATGALARQASGGRIGSAALGSLLAALATPGAWWAKCGLEPTLAAAILTFAMAVWAEEHRRNGGAGWRSSLLFFLALLARPESALAVLLAFVLDARAASSGEGIGAALASTLRRWAPLLVLGVGLEVARFAIFGDLLPNTFYAKEPGGLGALAAGALDVAKFFRSLGPFGLLLAVAAPLLMRSRPTASLLLALGSAGLFALHVVRVGGDYLGTDRYLLPIFPALLAAMVVGAFAGIDLLRGFTRRRRFVLISLAAAALLIPLVSGSARVFIRERSDLLRFAPLEGIPTYESDFASIGRALGRRVPADGRIGVVAAGATSFYSERPTLDLLGLNDRRIARIPFDRRPRRWSPGHMKGDAAEVLARRPEFLVLEIHSASEPGAPLSVAHLRAFPFVRDLVGSPEFRASYRPEPLEVSPGRWVTLWSLQVPRGGVSR